MSTFFLKQDDLVPAVTATLQQAVGAGSPTPIDLTTALSVRFLMRSRTTNFLKVDEVATVVSAVAGTVKYQWAGDDTDTPDVYNVEWQVVWATGVQSIPGAGYDKVCVGGIGLGVVYAPPGGSGLVNDGDIATLAGGVTAGISRDNLALDPAFASRYASSPAAADAIRYVTASGSDSNDGLSWGKAKATVEAAYAALPSTGGTLQLGAGTFVLAAAGAATGLTITPGKPCGIKGAGRSLSTIRYNGTGIGVLIGTGASFLDWGYLEDVTILAPTNAAVTGVKIDNAHRGYLNRAGIVGTANPAGSNALLGVNAYQNYVSASLLYGFEDGIELTTACHDFSVVNTSIDGSAICLHATDSHNVRLEGGQISGGAATVGVQYDDSGANTSWGHQILNTHFEGPLVDVKVGPAATTVGAARIVGVKIMCSLLNGIVIDKAIRPFLVTDMTAAGKSVSITANTTDAFVIYENANGGGLTDNGVRTTILYGAGLGKVFAGAITASGAVSAKGGYSGFPTSSAGNGFTILVDGQANPRFNINNLGEIAIGTGAAGADTKVGRKGGGIVKIGNSIAPEVLRTNGSGAGFQYGCSFAQIYKVTLTGNITSSSIVDTPADGQHFTLEFAQGASPPWTVVWPTNCLFVGGAAPTLSTVLGYRDSVTFVYDSTLTKWVEIARSVGVR